MNLRRVSTPVEVLAPRDCYLHLRLDEVADPPGGHYEDAQIQRYIAAARESAELYLSTSIAACQWELRACDWGGPDGLALPMPPVRDIVSVSYLDADANEWAVPPEQYRIAGSMDEPRLRFAPAWSSNWPELLSDPEAVRVRFLAGFRVNAVPPDVLPPAIVEALLLDIAHQFENRRGVTDSEKYVLPMGTLDRLAPFRRCMGV
jgi:uncharacterized phiE125 gp8 family phage protein